MTDWGSKGAPRRVLLFVAAFACALSIQAADLADPGLIPHVNQEARDTYRQTFLNAGLHRAFAIAPGGAWAWSSQQDSPDAAIAEAVKACRKYTEQTCMPYAVDRNVVFDAKAWTGLWRLDNTGPTTQLPTGVKRGQRFPDIAFTAPDGQSRNLGDLRGKIVLVHFWGSWCPPCLRELPALEIFYRILQDRLGEQFELVMLQVREPLEDARLFIELQGWDALPLSDSGAQDSASDSLALAGGGRIADRELARVFPSSYVIDQRGVVLFAHTGPVEDWSQYLPLFEEAAGVQR